jgi:hypothetical protein
MDEHRTALKRPGPAPSIVIALVVAIGAVIVGVRIWEGPTPSTESPQGSASPPHTSSAGAPTTPIDSSATLDPSTLAALLERVSSNELIRRFVAESDWVRRWAIVTDNLAEGASPRRQLTFAAPARPFTVEERGGATVIAAGSYRRYDAFGDAVASIDAEAIAAVYRAVHDPVEAAYRTLGYPSAPFDGVVARALERIEAAPVLDGDVIVRGEEALFVFEDSRLERLRDVEKHLLRMGPRNTRLLQAKAREIRRALALPRPRAHGTHAVSDHRRDLSPMRRLHAGTPPREGGR